MKVGGQAGDMLCLFCIKATYLPMYTMYSKLRTCSSIHKFSNAKANGTPMHVGRDVILARPMTAAGNRDPKAGHSKMPVSGGEVLLNPVI